MGACASAPEDEPSREPRRPRLTGTEAPDPSPLSGYNIPAGQCGMILWMRSGADVLPIFRVIDATAGTMTLDGKRTELTLQSQTGELRVGMRANQTFAAPGEEGVTTVESRLHWGQNFPAGAYIRGGTLTVSGADGWSRILPVAGIAGCKR
jgi:hypothetical protein